MPDNKPMISRGQRHGVAVLFMFLFMMASCIEPSETVCYEVMGMGIPFSLYFNGPFSFIPNTMFLWYRQTDIHKDPEQLLEIEKTHKLVKTGKDCKSDAYLPLKRISAETSGYDRSIFRYSLSLDFKKTQIIGQDTIKTRRHISTFNFRIGHSSVKFNTVLDQTSSYDEQNRQEIDTRVEYLQSTDSVDQYSIKLICSTTVLYLKIQSKMWKTVTRYGSLKITIIGPGSKRMKDPVPLSKTIEIATAQGGEIPQSTANLLIDKRLENNRLLFEVTGSDGTKIGRSLYKLKDAQFGQNAHPESDFEVHGLSLVFVDENTNFSHIQQAYLRLIQTTSNVHTCRVGEGRAYAIEVLWGGKVLKTESRYISVSANRNNPAIYGPLEGAQLETCKAKPKKAE